MLVELTILPMGRGTHLSDSLERAIEVIEASGLRHRVNPMGTLIEGEDPEAVWSVVRRCHEAVKATCPRIITEVRIDDSPPGESALRQEAAEAASR